MGNFSSISTRVNDSQIRNEVKEYPVVIYTKSSCSYCTKAKALLSEEKIEYEEKDLDAFYVSKGFLRCFFFFFLQFNTL